MTVWDWNGTVRLGVPSIDEQHKELIRRAEDLIEACCDGKGAEEITRMMDFLAEYVTEHFSDEERELQQAGFPLFEQHKILHDGFIHRCQGFRNEIAGGAGTRTLMMINAYLIEWITEHILGADRQAMEYIASRAEVVKP